MSRTSPTSSVVAAGAAPLAEPLAAPRSAAAAGPRLGVLAPWRAVGALAWREIVRFLRQRSRIVAAIGTPLVFWLLFGAGLERSFRLAPAEDAVAAAGAAAGNAASAGGPTFREFYFPGTLALVVLFTAIFSAISVIEDRREGFLQGVLASPAPRWAVVLGKTLGGAALAAGQGLLLVPLALTMSDRTTLAGLAGAAGMLGLLSLGLTAFGLAIAWRMESSQGFHAVMNLLLMPMWLLSGSFFPPPAVGPDASWVQWMLHAAMRLNPLTYGVAGLRGLLFEAPAGAAYWSPSAAECWGVTTLLAAGSLAAAWWSARRR